MTKPKASAVLWEEFARADVAVASILLYCLAHLVIRMLLGPNFSLDEAEQVLFAESLQWGYRFRHPPLITWLSYAVLAPTEASRAALFLLKYALMAGGLLAYFAAARVVLKDVRLAFLATAGLLTTFVMGFLPHQDLMHTILLAGMLAALLWLFFRVLERRALSDYAALGLCIGFGILAKYVFAMGIGALLIAALLVPEARKRLTLLGLAVTALVAGIVLAPYVSWVVANEYSFFELAEGITGGRGFVIAPLSWAQGAGNLVIALLGFAVPFILLFAPLFPKTLARVETSAPDARLYLRLMEIAMILAGLMMLAAVFFVGAESFKPRWMHQVLMPLPIYLFLRAKLTASREAAYKWFALGCFVFAALVVIARFAIYEINIDNCRRCREYRPMQEFALQVQLGGFQGGTILASDYDLGGNLRGLFPHSRVVTPGYPLAVFGAQNQGQCLIAWLGDRPMPPAMANYLRDELQAEVGPDAEHGRLTAHYLKSDTRSEILQYELLPDGSGQCR